MTGLMHLGCPTGYIESGRMKMKRQVRLRALIADEHLIKAIEYEIKKAGQLLHQFL
jgi:hypothetical protein